MKKRGKITYVPYSVVDEVNDIAREDLIPEGKGKSAEAFRTMVKYSKVGREAKRLLTMDWSRKKR
jgi:hypothetical protein